MSVTFVRVTKVNQGIACTVFGSVPARFWGSCARWWVASVVNAASPNIVFCPLENYSFEPYFLLRNILAKCWLYCSSCRCSNWSADLGELCVCVCCHQRSESRLQSGRARMAQTNRIQMCAMRASLLSLSKNAATPDGSFVMWHGCCGLFYGLCDKKVRISG